MFKYYLEIKSVPNEILNRTRRLLKGEGINKMRKKEKQINVFEIKKKVDKRIVNPYDILDQPLIKERAHHQENTTNNLGNNSFSNPSQGNINNWNNPNPNISNQYNPNPAYYNPNPSFNNYHPPPPPPPQPRNPFQAYNHPPPMNPQPVYVNQQGMPYQNGYVINNVINILNCPLCRKQTSSITTRSPGSVTWIWCFLLFLFTGCLCCIPFCIDSCQDTEVRCANCQCVKSRIPATC